MERTMANNLERSSLLALNVNLEKISVYSALIDGGGRF